MSDLSDQEHMARAMLLGRVYDWRDHTYCVLNIHGSPVIPDDCPALDADTLEPVNHDCSYQRLRENQTLHANWKLGRPEKQ